jgi:hypothetical protein
MFVLSDLSVNSRIFSEQMVWVLLFQRLLDDYIWGSSQCTNDLAKLNIYGLKLEGLRVEKHLIHNCYDPVNTFIPHSSHITEGIHFSFIPLPNGGRHFSSFTLTHDFMVSTKTVEFIAPTTDSNNNNCPSIGSLFIQPPQSNHPDPYICNNWCAVIVWNEPCNTQLDISILQDIYGSHYPKWTPILRHQTPSGLKYVEEVLPAMGTSSRVASTINRVKASKVTDRSYAHDVELRQTIAQLVEAYHSEKIAELKALIVRHTEEIADLQEALIVATERTAKLEVRQNTLELVIGKLETQISELPEMFAKINEDMLNRVLTARGIIPSVENATKSHE